MDLPFLTFSSPAAFALLCLIFLVAGSIKGLTGFGMPLVGIPLTILLMNVPATTVMGWMLTPIFATNMFQVVALRRHVRVLPRLWPLFLGLVLALIPALSLLTVLPQDLLSLIVGVLVLVVTASQFMRPLTVSPRRRGPLLFVAGLVSGAIGGTTSFFGFPAVHALLAVSLEKTEFIFAVSLMFLLSGVVLAVGLGGYGLIGQQDLVISLLVVWPALAGLWLGQVLRQRLSLEVFRRVVMVVLLLVGCSMIYKGL